MTRQFKIFLKICFTITALICVGWIAHLCSLQLMKYVDRCDMPCQGIYNKGFDSCDPLKADLEVKTTPEPRGHGVAVWYRATVANRSCRIIQLNENFFNWNDWVRVSSTTSILVMGPDGRPAPEPKSSLEGMDIRNPEATLEKLIDPYHYDARDVSPAIIMEKGFDGNPLYHLQLRPGQSVSASYSVLDPTRRKVVEMSGNGYVGTGIRHVPVPMEHPEKTYAVPPPGFRRLDEFDLRKPGRYTVQLIIQDHLFTDRYDDPKRPLWNKLRPWIYLFATGFIGGEYQEPIDVKIKSATREFEIPR